MKVHLIELKFINMKAIKYSVVAIVLTGIVGLSALSISNSYGQDANIEKTEMTKKAKKKNKKGCCSSTCTSKKSCTKD